MLGLLFVLSPQPESASPLSRYSFSLNLKFIFTGVGGELAASKLNLLPTKSPNS